MKATCTFFVKGKKRALQVSVHFDTMGEMRSLRDLLLLENPGKALLVEYFMTGHRECLAIFGKDDEKIKEFLHKRMKEYPVPLEDFLKLVNVFKIEHTDPAMKDREALLLEDLKDVFKRNNFEIRGIKQ